MVLESQQWNRWITAGKAAGQNQIPCSFMQLTEPQVEEEPLDSIEIQEKNLNAGTGSPVHWAEEWVKPSSKCGSFSAAQSLKAGASVRAELLTDGET